MTHWFSRHPILVWGLAWGCTAMGETLSMGPPQKFGDLVPERPWAFVMVGAMAWGLAGALAFHGGGRRRSGFVVWAAAFLIGTGLGVAVWQAAYRPIVRAPIYGFLMAWAAGMTLGPLLGGVIERPPMPLYRRLFHAGLWLLYFFLAPLPVLALSNLSLQLLVSQDVIDGPWYPLLVFGAATLGGSLAGQLAVILRYALLGALSGADEAVG